jgi:hypothetical protein
VQWYSKQYPRNKSHVTGRIDPFQTFNFRSKCWPYRSEFTTAAVTQFVTAPSHPLLLRNNWTQRPKRHTQCANIHFRHSSNIPLCEIRGSDGDGAASSDSNTASTGNIVIFGAKCTEKSLLWLLCCLRTLSTASLTDEDHYGELMEWYWQGKPEVLGEKKNCPSATSLMTNPTPTDLESNLGLSGRRSLTNLWATALPSWSSEWRHYHHLKRL